MKHRTFVVALVLSLALPFGLNVRAGEKPVGTTEHLIEMDLRVVLDHLAEHVKIDSNGSVCIDYPVSVTVLLSVYNAPTLHLEVSPHSGLSLIGSEWHPPMLQPEQESWRSALDRLRAERSSRVDSVLAHAQLERRLSRILVHRGEM